MSSIIFKSFNTKTAFQIAFPLMLVALSGNMMLFFGRFVLAKYDMEAMNAVASTILICNIFQVAGMSVTTIAEIFVGQHNGAKNFKQIPHAVWQMIWLSVSLILIFVPVALWGGDFLVLKKFQTLGLPYFRATMFFGFLVPLLGALASFFVGTGKTGPLIISAIIANVVNCVLNIVLVFGWGELIFPMGVVGAAVATGIALCLQAAFLLYIFLNADNHRTYHTRHFGFDIVQMIQCLKIGYPSALSRMLEIGGWATIIAYLSKMGDDYVTVQAICHSLLIMFMFTAEGLSKGVTAMAANAIGQGSTQQINQIVRSASNILIIVLIFLWFILWHAPHLTILKLMNQTQFINQDLIAQVSLALKGLWVYFAFNGFSLIIWGVLTAGGDTKFIMWVNSVTTWLFAVIPTYIWVEYFSSTAAVPYQYIAPVYGMLGFIIVVVRFYKQSWLKVNLMHRVQTT